MREYILDDGFRVVCSSDYEFVLALKQSSKFAYEEPIMDYIKGFAERKKMHTGDDIRFGSVKDFVADLTNCNILVVVQM